MVLGTTTNPFGRVLAIGAISALMPCVAYAHVTLKLEALTEAVPATQSRAACIESHGPATNAMNIALGDPVGLKLSLTNEAKADSEAMPVSLNPAWMPAVIVVVHPDGKESLSSLGDPRRERTEPSIRPMTPGEQLEAELCVYTDLASEVEAEYDGRYEYLFPTPGEYRIYAAYFTRLAYPPPEEKHRIGWMLERIRRRDGVIVSEMVQVKVGEAFPGWDRLRAAGIARAVRFGNWESEQFSDEIRRAPIDALVQQANRPWLQAWYSEVRKIPPESTGERAGGK